MQVHTGREHDLVPVTPCFIAQKIAQHAVEFRIERGRARRCRRHSRRHGLGEAVTPADPGATVDHAYGWDCQFGNALDVTPYRLESAARRPIRIIPRGPSVVGDLLDLLFERHLGNQQVGALLRAEVRVHPRQNRNWRLGHDALCGDQTEGKCHRCNCESQLPYETTLVSHSAPQFSSVDGGPEATRLPSAVRSLAAASSCTTSPCRSHVTVCRARWGWDSTSMGLPSLNVSGPKSVRENTTVPPGAYP